MIPTKFSALLWVANYCLCLLTFYVCFLPFKPGKNKPQSVKMFQTNPSFFTQENVIQ